MTTNDELDQFCNFSDKLITLPFPFIGKPPWDRFEMLEREAQDTTEFSAPGHFGYYGREVFREAYDDRALDARRGRSMYYLHGALGYGKSYILAALAVLLIRKAYKIVCLSDCRQLVRGFYWYFKKALVLGDELYFIID